MLSSDSETFSLRGYRHNNKKNIILGNLLNPSDPLSVFGKIVIWQGSFFL